MSASLLTPPAAEPWTVAEAKAFLRVETDDDDALIGSLIAAARSQIEAQARCALLTQTWRIVRDAWPGDGRIPLRLTPLRSIAAARVLDEHGVAATLDVDRFVITGAGAIATPVWSLPQPGRVAGGIEIDVVAGYGANPGDVPHALRHAVRLLVSHWYDHRGLSAIGGAVAMLPGSVNAMIASFRGVSL
jgi:uncharacterized phiE125 gp8 family phage protein